MQHKCDKLYIAAVTMSADLLRAFLIEACDDVAHTCIHTQHFNTLARSVKHSTFLQNYL
jgi:hypothetical protein